MTEVEPVVAFVRSRSGEPAERLEAVRAHVAGGIAKEGAFAITTDTARIRCRNP